MSNKLTEVERKYLGSVSKINKFYFGLVVVLIIAFGGIVFLYWEMLAYINANVGKKPEITFEEFKGLVNCLFLLCVISLIVPAGILILKIRSTTKLKRIIDKLV